MDHCSAGQPVSGPFQQKARVYGLAVGIALVAATFAGFHAWREQQVRTYPLELDGWGYSIMRLQESGHDFGTLFREPSLWRGPVVPFLYGLCYYLAPCDESVLIFNVAVFAVAAGLLVLTFCYLGAGRLAAAAAVLGWVFYWPNARTFGYYFAEPTIVLFVVLLLLLVAWTIQRQSAGLAFLTGAVAGVLLLCKAPFLVLVGCLPFFLAYHLHCPSADRHQPDR